MNPERWQDVERICASALELEPALRKVFVREACAGDESLLREVTSLLAVEGKMGSLFESPAWEVVAKALAEEKAPDRQEDFAGRTLSHYLILEKLGQGGMGVVYKARDAHLDRFVALKVLPAERVADPDRRWRFVREAKAASALNHPNIVTIHDIESADGIPFITMEYVEGKTLTQLVARKKLPLKDGLRIAVQIADALAAAHARGIVHRDLKPSNVMLTGGGHVKLLDFGLAKLVEAVGEDESAVSQLAKTSTGIVVGTPSYMSPEQAEGKPVDARTDVFSFGSLLYEMATGKRAFTGESPASILSMLLNREPVPVRSIAQDVPRDLERIIELCLKKDPNRRLQSMADVKLQLESLKEELASGTLTAPLVGGISKPGRGRIWAGPAVLAIISAAAAWLWWPPDPPPAEPEAALTRLTYDGGFTTDPALSPDGRLLAYASDRAGAGGLDIWVQQIGGGEPLRLTKDGADNRAPSFSPDGTKIVFRSTHDGGGIYTIPALGGAARTIASDAGSPVFSPDGDSVAYYTGNADAATLANAKTELLVVNTAGGAPREIQTGFSGVCCAIWTPDGKHLLFLGNRDARLPLEKSLDWWVAPLDGRPAVKTGALEITFSRGLRGPVATAPMALLPGAWSPRNDGVVFSARSGHSTNLWQVDISPVTFKATGEVRRLTSGTAFESQPSVAPRPGGGSRVVFTSLSENSEVWSLPIAADEARPAGGLERLTNNAAADFHPDLSADGTKLIFISTRTGSDQIWLKDLKTGEETAITSSATEKFRPRLSADASALAYSQSGTWSIYLVRLAGGGEELVSEAIGLATSWAPDGGGFFFHDVPGRVSFLDFASRQRTQLLAKPDHRLIGTEILRDGKWLSFAAHSASHCQIFVAPYQGPGPIEEKDWIALTDDRFWASDGIDSPGSGVIYFLSNRDGNRCIWAQRLDPTTKRPSGPPIDIYHEHRASRSVVESLALGRGRLAFCMVERTGDIWMAEYR